jgi:hypothetical protein
MNVWSFFFSLADQQNEDSSFDLKRTIDYIKFLSSLVGDCYAISPEMVSLEIPDYEFLNNWLMKFRPGEFFFVWSFSLSLLETL